MSNQQRKLELAARVDLAVADNYKTKKQTQKRMTCSQCGKKYLGQENSSTCGPACRTAKSRSN